MRDRQRLSKFCLGHDRTLPPSAWTVARRKWLSEQRFEFVAQQQTFDTYVHTVDLVDARIEQLERAIRETAEQQPWRELVGKLRCLRGIDTLTALALVTEIGEFSRFRSAEEFMAFVGLVPSERSSGEQRRQGSISKVGNAHARRLLVESAWHARRRPTVGYQLARRQRGQDPAVVLAAPERLRRRLGTLAGSALGQACARLRLGLSARSCPSCSTNAASARSAPHSFSSRAGTLPGCAARPPSQHSLAHASLTPRAGDSNGID